MTDWIIGIALVAMVAGLSWLVREWCNAPLCDDETQCF